MQLALSQGKSLSQTIRETDPLELSIWRMAQRENLLPESWLQTAWTLNGVASMWSSKPGKPADYLPVRNTVVDDEETKARRLQNALASQMATERGTLRGWNG